jgi:hypothetical protein
MLMCDSVTLYAVIFPVLLLLYRLFNNCDSLRAERYRVRILVVRGLPHPSVTAVGPTTSLVPWVYVSFAGGKATGAWR